MKANYEEDKVIVSTTEPTGVNRKKVWIKKGKNLVNVSQIILGYALWSTDGTTLIYTERGYFDYILVNSNTEYSISNCTPTAICFYDKNKSFISAVTGETAFTTPSDCTYIRFSINITEEYSNIQFEQGAVATDYEQYIEPEIYILNSNNVYEKFEKDENKETILFEGSVKFGNNVCVIPDNIRYVEVYFKIPITNGAGINKNSIKIDTSYTPTSTECIGTLIACTGKNFAEIEMNFYTNRCLKADYIATYANLNSDAVNKNNTDGFEVYKVVGYK